MLLLLLLQTQSPLAARADTIHPVHDALHYDITLVPSDTGNHVLAEVQTSWRLRSAEPVEMELDSAMRVVRVLVDGKPNTRLSRTLYARSESEIEVPHEKSAGDTLTTRVRYHGQVRDGLIIGANQYGARTIFADNWPDRAHLWLASQDHPPDLVHHQRVRRLAPRARSDRSLEAAHYLHHSAPGLSSLARRHASQRPVTILSNISTGSDATASAPAIRTLAHQGD